MLGQWTPLEKFLIVWPLRDTKPETETILKYSRHGAVDQAKLSQTRVREASPVEA